MDYKVLLNCLHLCLVLSSALLRKQVPSTVSSWSFQFGVFSGVKSCTLTRCGPRSV